MDEQKVERPTLITVICVLMALGAVVAIPMVMAVGSRLPGWYSPFVLVSAAIGIICMLGLWAMRKWAVYLYVAMTAVGQIVLLASHLWVPTSIIIPAVVIVVMFMTIDKMR